MRKDGSRFWGDVVITALHDEAGNLTGYAKVTRDRTDMKAIEDAQDAFYAAFNHDFRTPVTALKGFVDALRDADDEDRDMLIDRVEASADRLLGMVEGLVAVRQPARRQGRDPASRTSTSPRSRAARSVTWPRPWTRRGCRSPDDVALATANGVAMHRVVTNLLVNALKYSPPDTPVDGRPSRRPAPGLIQHRGRRPGPRHRPRRPRHDLRRVRPRPAGGGRRRHRPRARQRARAGATSRRARRDRERGRRGHHGDGRAALRPALQAVGADSARVVPVSGPWPPPRVDAAAPEVGADRPLPRVVLGRGLHLLAQLLARPVVEPVAEDRAQGVVGLVLEAPGEQAVALVGDVLAVEALAGDPRARSGRAQSTKAPG